MTQGTATGRRGLFRLFRNGSFALLWSGSLASQLGDHLNLMALTALIFTLSEGQIKGAEFSRILLLASAPVMFVGPISGVYADRLNRKRMMIVADLLRAGLVALIPLLALSMAPIYVIVFLVFTINRFFLSAKQAAIPQIVRAEDLMAANSLLNVAMMAALVLGPWGGGALVERLGHGVGFWADSATYLLSATLASFMTLRTLAEMRRDRQARSVRRETAVGAGRLRRTRIVEGAAKLGHEIAAPIEDEVEVIGSAYGRLVADLRDGLRRMRGNRTVVFSTVSYSAVMFVAGFVLIICPVLTRNEFGAGTTDIGMLFSAGGVGMLLGSLVAGRFFQATPRRALIVASFLLGGIDIVVFSQAGTPLGLGLGVFLLGFFVAPTMVACDVILQESMPGDAVGKAFGFRDMVSRAAFGVAGIASGFIVDFVGPRHLLVAVGIACAGYSVVSLFLCADTRKLNLINAYPLMALGAKLAARLPRRVSYAIAIFLSDLASLLLREKRRGAEQNMSRVIGKPVGSREVRSLARRMFRSYGLYYADFFGLNGIARGKVGELVRIEGLENLTSALERGKGAIFVTAHIGSWDMGGAALAATDGLPRLSAIVEPVEKENSNSAVTSMRERRGIKVIPIGSALGVWRALRRNEIVFVVGERVIGAEGVSVDFFGEKTVLPRGAAYLALKSGAAIVPGFCIRQPDGTYVGHIEPAIETSAAGDFESDVRRNTQSIAAIIEKYVSEYPEQWCMLQPMWRGACESG